jgi:hypothetical protein
MHCPSCGNESSLDQKFCRKCGFNLEPVSKLVVQCPPAQEVQLDKHEQDKALTRRMFRIMGWGLVIVLIGVVLLVITRGFAPDRLVNLLGLLGSIFLLGGTAVAGYSIFDAIRESTKPALPRARVTKDGEMSQAEITKQLLEERIPVPVPSVTERTTQLIASESKTGKPE